MAAFYQDSTVQLLNGDVLAMLATLPDEYVQTCVTSPPYWGLRDYGVEGQLGLEKTPEEYVEKMVAVFREVRRVLKDDGTLWLNLGDSYAGSGKGPSNEGSKQRSNGGSLTEGSGRNQRQFMNGQAPKEWLPVPRGLKPKDLVGIPWRVAFALQADGWYLRSDIIWHKPNPMPESVTDRPTKAHEYIFLLTKSERYFYDHEAIKEPAIYAEEARYDPRTNGLWGADRKTGKTTRRFAAAKASETPRNDGERWNENNARGFKPSDKQRGHSRRHNGFNDRWDQMTKTEQCSNMRNKRSVWTVGTTPYPDAHFATFPEKLIEPCILAGARSGDIVLDPFAGSGTTLAVSKRLGRRAVGIELNPDYCELAIKRIGYQEVLAL